MRAARILTYVVASVIGVVLLVLLSVWLFVNPNHYKDRIAAQVKRATGRDLKLEGDIKLSVFPWIALELGPAALGNPPGFSAQPFVTFKRAALRAKLWPLLNKRLEIARVEVDGMTLRLEKNPAGHGNWESSEASARDTDGGAASLREPGAAGREVGDNGSDDNDGSGGLAGIPGIKLTDARVIFDAYRLQNLRIETAPLHDGVVPLSIAFDADRGVPSEHFTLDGKVSVSNPEDGRYGLAALGLVGEVTLAGASRPIRWDLTAPAMDIDFDAQTVELPGFSLGVAGARFSGNVSGTAVRGDARWSGALALAPLVLREFIPRFGGANPDSRDPRAFARAEGSTKFAFGGNALRLDELRATLDDTHLQGTFAVTDLAAHALEFALAVDRIDLDRYFTPDSDESNKDAPRATSRQAAGSTEMPADATAPLRAAGTLQVGALHFARLDVSDLSLTLNAHEGVVRIFPLQALVDGGRYSGDVKLDNRAEISALSVESQANGMDMGRLLAPRGKSIHLSGKGNFKLQAAGRGNTSSAVLRTLNGRVEASVSDGAVEGIDLGFQLARGESLIKRESTVAASDTGRTPFTAFKLSADIANGIAHTSDLLIASPVLKVTGQGNTNLATDGIDFQLVADTLRSAQGVPIQLPVRVTGSTSSPVVRPDLEAFAKGPLKQKLQDVLQDKLKGLFGKP